MRSISINNHIVEPEYKPTSQMTRSEYLETVEGQINERIQRFIKKNHLVIPQEPKSKKSISSDEKRKFREEVRRQLKNRNRRAHRGNLVLEIDFYTTQDNPPALQSLCKNYLDLLHKEMHDIDKHKRLLFKDDSQIKILIANCHLDTFGGQVPCIRIITYPLSSFRKDIELVDRILSNRFSDNGSFSGEEFFWDYERDKFNPDSSDTYDDLIDLERNKDSIIQRQGVDSFQLRRNILLSHIQEVYLSQNEITVRNLISLFQNGFSYNRKYATDKTFKAIWNNTRDYIFLTSNFVGLGETPTKSGDTKLFKRRLQEQLTKFKEKHPVLFPLLQPVNLTITFIPPYYNIPDLDNIAKTIFPSLIEIFEPPAVMNTTVHLKYFGISAEEPKAAQKIAPHLITGFQIIQIPRKAGGPENGRIDFFLTDGVRFKFSIRQLIDDIIDKWEEVI